MRILMLSWEFPPRVVGGLARHVYELSSSLARLGHQVFVVTPWVEGAPEYAEEEGVHVYRTQVQYPTAQDFFTSICFLNFALLEKAIAIYNSTSFFDLIHAHDWLVAFTARALKHSLRLPLVATFHATEWGRNGGLHNDLQRQISDVEWWLSYEAWRVICCSEHMFRELRNTLQVPEDKLMVIPNGVRPEDLKPPEGTDLAAFRARYARPEEKIVFFIGRLVQEKGAQVLVEAMPKILTYYPQTRFVIAGTGPLAGALQARVRQLGVEDRVHFPGFIDDGTRNALYACADVAVFPSLYEPFGIVALEAMAAGTPMVVADSGGFSEIVVHGVNGLKAYPGDPDSLANNILTLLYDPTLAQELRAEGRRDIETYYGWQHLAAATAAVYEEVVEEFRFSPWRPLVPVREGEALLQRVSDYFYRAAAAVSPQAAGGEER